MKAVTRATMSTLSVAWMRPTKSCVSVTARFCAVTTPTAGGPAGPNWAWAGALVTSNTAASQGRKRRIGQPRRVEGGLVRCNMALLRILTAP